VLATRYAIESGDVKVIVFPEIEAISFISLVIRPFLANQEKDAGAEVLQLIKVPSNGHDELAACASSTNLCTGQCMAHATLSLLHTSGGLGPTVAFGGLHPWLVPSKLKMQL
jgi:hypothetical protein